MHDLTLQTNRASDGQKCIPDIDYEDTLTSKYGDPLGCGTWLAYPYFISFVIIMAMVIMNLYVAVVLEGFSESSNANDDKNAIKPYEIEEFNER